MKISHMALIISLACLGKTATAASFDCKKATTYVEHTICLMPELSTLDDQLNVLYKSAMRGDIKTKSDLKQEQLIWLRDVRNKATSEQEVRDAYINRINDISVYLNNGKESQEVAGINQRQTMTKQLESMKSHHEYIKYDPVTHKEYFDSVITGPCAAENLRFENLDFNLKVNFNKMTDAKISQGVEELKKAERVRWICIEKELNKKNITLDLKSIFESRNLGPVEAFVKSQEHSNLAKKGVSPAPSTQSNIPESLATVVDGSGFYQQLDDFSKTSSAETLSAGLSQSELKQAAQEIKEDIKSFINYVPSDYYSTLRYNNEDLASIARGRNDNKTTTYFLARDVLAGNEKRFKAMGNLGLSYLYGRDALVKDDKKARLILAFAASNGYHYARYIIANDYLFSNTSASKTQLEYIGVLMKNTPWFAQYEALKKSAEFRVANYDGYLLKITCVANNTVRTNLNISKCAKPYTIHLKGDKEVGYDLSDSSAPAWRNYNGTSILYTPNHFSFSTKNGDGNTLLIVEVVKIGSLTPENTYQVESYQEISFTR